MKSEGHVDTNKLSASRKDKNSTKCTDLKPSRCCKSYLSTPDTTRKRESSTSEFNAGVNFDDKEEFHVNQQNEDLAHGKRKLPRKTKGFNVKSKLRKTFTMCCANGQDTSLDEEDENEYDNIEREKRADEDGANGEHTSDESATAVDKQPKTGELQQLQSFWKILKPYHITEHPNMCSAPTNVLQVYASDLTTSDSSTSASSDSISALLDEIDADFRSPVRCTDLKDLPLLRSFNIDPNIGALMQAIDTFRNNIEKLSDNPNAQPSVSVNKHTTFIQNDVKVAENQQQNCIIDQLQTTCKMDSTVPVNSQLNANRVFVNQPPASCSVNCGNSTENSNNGTIGQNSNSTVQHKRRLLHDVHTMLLSGEIGFVRLQGNDLPGADDGNLVEFIYSNSGFSHEEARDILKAINRLINNKMIEFRFSEDQASVRNFTVSSFNGEKLTLSQDVDSSVSEDEINSNEQNSSLDRDEARNSKVYAVVTGIFDASDNCDKKMRDYVTMIRDKRFPNVLEDILRVGEGRISSVADYVDILRRGHFSPVFDGIVDVDDSDKLQDYIRTITEGNFCTALENALKACRGNSYSLSEYIEVIRDEYIGATLGLTLLASELPDEYVQLLFQGTGDGDLSNSSADTSTQCSISVEMLRRVSISTIHKNIAIKRALQNTDLLVKYADDFISRLSAKGQSHGTTSDTKEPEVKFSDVDDNDPMSVCDGFGVIRKLIANCQDDSQQRPNVIFVDDALFRQGDTENETLQSSKHATYKAKDNSAKWAVSDPIVRPFNRSSTKCGSTFVEKNRSKSKYNVPKTQSSGVTIATTGCTSMLDNVSGAAEVKRSKAEYAMDLSETEDTSNTTGFQNRIIKTARRRTRSVAVQEYEFAMSQPEPETETVPYDEKKGKKPTVNVLSPLRFIDTDVEVNALKEKEAAPVYIETEATIDYGRCAVEPGHGERPDKKKLRAEIKEKVKTKGEANKHLRNERECRATDYDAIMEEYLADIDDTECGDDIENEPEQQEEDARAVSPVVPNAVDQPQVLDDREFHLVPEEIKRPDDPYLEDVEEDYKVWTTHSNKKEKRKQKDDRKKEKRTRKSGQTVLKLS